ncbi:MAG: site-specific DNA-methyltransferase [Bacteroidota bacterium]
MPRRSKLKRDRKAAKPPAAELFEEHAAVGEIVRQAPTAEHPALRAFKPPRLPARHQQLARHGILDANGLKIEVEQSGSAALYNRVICGDTLEVIRQIPASVVECIITSPPYWNTVDYGFEGQYGQCSYEEYLGQLLAVWSECSRVLKPNGKLCINSPIMPISKKVLGRQHTRHLKNINNDIEHSILQTIHHLHRFGLYIWQKQTTEKMFGSYPYPPNLYEQNTVEFINVFVKDGPPEKLPLAVKEESRLSDAEWMDLTKQVWNLYPEDVKRVRHPAPFPTALANRLIAMYTFRRAEELGYRGSLIMDPFCGTGATCVAARELGRNYLGIDAVPEFCIETARRSGESQHTKQIVLLKNNINRQSQIQTESPPRLL